jgi:hypothetical protein
MKIVVKIPVKPRLGPQKPQTGAGTHSKGYQRRPKHPKREDRDD